MMTRTMMLAGALLAGCGGTPPCHPEADSVGTVDTPPVQSGSGSNGDTYKKGADGETCVCSPYDSGCTTDPSGTPPSDEGAGSSSSSASSGAGGPPPNSPLGCLSP